MIYDIHKQINEYIARRIRERKSLTPPTEEDINGFAAEFMERFNNLPREEFEGYAPHEMAVLLNNTFDKDSPLGIKPLSIADCREIPMFRQVDYLMEAIAAESSVKLTPKGNLPTKITKDMYVLGAPEDFIERGITKLRSEDDSISVQIAHWIVTHIGAVRKRANALSLTKKGGKFLTDKPKLAVAIIEAVTTDYYSGNFDLMRQEMTGHLGVGFVIILLLKYGATERLDEFYSEKYFQAFPEMVAEEGGLHCFSLRMFQRRLIHLGIIEIEQPNQLSANFKVSITQTPLLDKLFYFHQPRFILNVGKS